ncbi:MAG: biotin/lipoate A/B protein ligase family protein [Planctomycetota bacterium]
MAERWRLLLHPETAPADAMAVDEALLIHHSAPTLRLYRWRPFGVSIGYFQRYEELPIQQLASEGTPVIRRLTGGGAIYHGEEVTFSITAPSDHLLFRGPVRDSYDRVHSILTAALLECCKATTNIQPRGAATLQSDASESPWCFHESTEFDLSSNSRKLVGSAQRRTGGRVLHHGSIILKTNPYTSEIASIEMLGGAPNPAIVEDAIIRAFSQSLQITLEPGDLSGAEHDTANKLAAEKYNSDAWNRRR